MIKADMELDFGTSLGDNYIRKSIMRFNTRLLFQFCE